MLNKHRNIEIGYISSNIDKALALENLMLLSDYAKLMYDDNLTFLLSGSFQRQNLVPDISAHFTEK